MVIYKIFEYQINVGFPKFNKYTYSQAAYTVTEEINIPINAAYGDQKCKNNVPFYLVENAKDRELEARLAAVIGESNLKGEQYEKTISKLQADFEHERKQLKLQIAKERETADKNETRLKTLHATLTTELHTKISQLETKNELNEAVILQLNQDLSATRTQVKRLENKWQKRESTSNIEHIRAQDIFNLLGTYFQENQNAWNDVEGICMGKR